MNGKRMQFVIALLATFLLGSSLTVNNAFAHDRGGRRGHDPMFMIIHKLDLTDAQKPQVAAILKAQESQAKTIATGIAQARSQLVQAILSGQDVTAASGQVATYMQQSAALRSAIIGQIIPILTPDQQGTLQNIQAKIENRQSKIGTDEWLTRRFARWDKFIGKYSAQ